MSTFGVPITDDTLKQMPRYKGRKITQEDRAREAKRLIQAEDKHLGALNHAMDLKNSHGDGATALVLIYNATGDTLELVEDQMDWLGNVYPEKPPSSFQNGQWVAFIHTHGSQAARIFRGHDITGQVRDYLVAWSVPSDRTPNSAYTEVRDKDHFIYYWDYIKSLLDSAGRVTRDQSDEYCASTVTVGGYTCSEFVAVLQHKFVPEPDQDAL